LENKQWNILNPRLLLTYIIVRSVYSVLGSYYLHRLLSFLRSLLRQNLWICLSFLIHYLGAYENSLCVLSEESPQGAPLRFEPR
jgi:hypothetical protein